MSTLSILAAPRTPSESAARPSPRPRLGRRLAHAVLHLHVAIHADALDRALAHGADPRTRPALVMRAAQLERPRRRRALARTLRRIVADSARPGAGPALGRSGRIPIARAEVREDADALLALAERLACPHPAQAAGIAIAQRLVTDGVDSPLHSHREPHALGHLAGLAVAAMSPID